MQQSIYREKKSIRQAVKSYTMADLIWQGTDAEQTEITLCPFSKALFFFLTTKSFQSNHLNLYVGCLLSPCFQISAIMDLTINIYILVSTCAKVRAKLKLKTINQSVNKPINRLEEKERIEKQMKPICFSSVRRSVSELYNGRKQSRRDSRARQA